MSLPRTASAVIIGGGVVGCSIAYHLARRGLHDVVVLERETVGSGTTSKAAGGIRVQFSSETEIRFSLESIRLFERFQEEFGVDPGYRKIGYLYLLSEERHLREFEKRIALQRTLGADVRVLTPADAQKLVPALRVDDLIAAVWGPQDGMAGPAEVTNGFARRARDLGAAIVEGVAVTALERSNGQVTGVKTSQDAVSTPIVVNAAGPAAARVGRLAGLELPVHPRRRHIFFTEPFPEIPGPVPLTSDVTSGFYFRKEMEQMLLSPGDVEDIGDDANVPMDWGKVEELVPKAIQRLPIIERARIGGGWYAQAGGFVELVKSKDPSFNIKVVPGAGIQNMTKLQQGETEIAWGLPPFIAASYNGQDPYPDKHADMRLVMNGLGYVHVQFCVADDVPARSIREVFEKKLPLKIGTTPPGGSDEWVLRKIFEFYRTTYNDVRGRGGKVVLVSYTDLVTQFRDRNLDVLVPNLAVPGAAIQEASLGRKMRILPMDDDLLKYLEGFGLARGVVPPASYKDVVNNTQAIPTITMANTIVANAKVPEGPVYEFTKILLGDLEAVRKVHPAFKDFNPKDAVRLANVPLHPGAASAYKEAGLH